MSPTELQKEAVALPFFLGYNPQRPARGSKGQFRECQLPLAPLFSSPAMKGTFSAACFFPPLSAKERSQPHLRAAHGFRGPSGEAPVHLPETNLRTGVFVTAA